MEQLYVVESLRENDEKVGKQIFDSLESSHPKSSKFFSVQTQEEFYDALEAVVANISGFNMPCLLHIDCHGDEEGIQLGDDTCIDWKDLRKHCRSLYESTGNRLVVCMSACRGIHMSRLVAHFEPCPFYALVGSFEDLGFDASAIGFTAFYTALLNGKSITEALDQANLCAPEIKLLGYKAEQLFEMGFNGYIKKLTPEYLDAEKGKKIALVRKFFGEDKRRIALVSQLCSLEGQLKLLEDRYRRTFFS